MENMKVTLPSGKEVTIKALPTVDEIEKFHLFGVMNSAFDHLIVVGKCNKCEHEITLADVEHCS
jgi:hypothetical protein